MGEFYSPYPKLPKNIRQIGDRDLNVKLYVEDYVNTYLKRLYPAGGQDLRVGLLLGEARSQDGVPYLFADGALEMEGVVENGSRVEFTQEAWDKAYGAIEQKFPKRTVLGWFLCSSPDHTLSPLNYWKEHSRYFPEKNQLMYLSCGLEGEEAVYMASEDGFYRLRGYCIYYERNQMMQDYMVSRRDVHRVEPGSRDTVIRDFRQKMEDNREEARRRRSTLGSLQTACGVLSVMVLACGVAMFNNYHRIREMESVIASALPEDIDRKWSDFLGREEETKSGEQLVFEEVPGEVYPTRPEIEINPETMPSGGGGPEEGMVSGSQGGQQLVGQGNQQSGMSSAGQGDQQSGMSSAGQGNQQTGLSSAGQESQQPGLAPADQQVSQNPSGRQSAPDGGQAGTEGQPSGENVGSDIPSDEAGSSDGASDNSASARSADGNQESAQGEMTAEPVQVPSDAIVHIVQDGETLYGICLDYYHSVNNLSRICQWNQLSDENHLSVGQKLYLPSAE